MSRISMIIPTFSGGGMERAMSQLANYFNEKGHEVHIIFLIKHNLFYEISPDIKTHVPDFDYVPDPGLKKIFYWARVILYVREMLKRIEPDTIFSVPQGYNNISILASRGLGIPIYVSDRNSPAKKTSFIKAFLKRIFYPHANGIISQTSYAKQALLKAGIKNNNITVISNPVKEIKHYPKKENGKKIVLNVGRFVMEKNQEELIEIFSRIKDPNWVLHIVGDGPLKGKLEGKIRQLEMEDRVYLLEPAKDIDLVLSQADIFAFTSVLEGYPNALNEAMAYPLACIAYDCIAGPSDMITDGYNGYLVRSGDKSGYIEKLKNLIEDSELRNSLKEKALLSSKQRSLEVIGSQYLSFILTRPL